MSSTSPTDSTAVAPEPSASAHPAPLTGGRRNALRVGYAASVIAAVTLAAGLITYEATSTPDVSYVPSVPPGPGKAFPGDTVAARNQVNPAVLANVSTLGTETGVVVNANTTATAADDPVALSNQLSALTAHSCSNNVEIVTPDNFVLNAWNFCFTPLPLEEVTEYVDAALDSGATNLAIFNRGGGSPTVEARFVWLPTTEEEYDEALAQWAEIKATDTVGEVRFFIHGTEKMAGVSDVANAYSSTRRPLDVHTDIDNSRVQDLGIYRDAWITPTGEPMY